MDDAAWDARYRTSELVWGSEPNQFVRQLCQRLPVGEALDLACGEGRNALWLARLGWFVLGVDFSAVATDRARELTRTEPVEVQERVRWRTADLLTFTPRARSVSLALISYLHLPPVDLGHVVASAARAVRPGGHIVMVGHDKTNLEGGVGGPQDPELLYEPAAVAAWVRAHGLVVELDETVQRPTEHGTALDALIHARRPAVEV